MKKALLTGCTGQDGSYLTELLLNKGYTVYGMIRRSATPHTQNIKHIKDEKFIIRTGDLTDKSSIERILMESQPSEFYNLAAQSFVPASWTNPQLTFNVTAGGVLNCLDAIKYYQEHSGNEVRFYQAGSSEQFGKVRETPQNEDTPFYPRSPYGCAKCYGYEITRNYRESYGMHAVTGILFNHESPRRGYEFVTRKITSTLARIVKGEEEELLLGNLESKRDWGYAGDYVKAQWMMLQQDEPVDYVIATGETHTIREFAELACQHAGMGSVEWKGSGLDEKGYCDGKQVIGIDEKYYRPAEVELLLGDSSKAQKELGWKPEVTFQGLVKMMMEYDLKQ